MVEIIQNATCCFLVLFGIALRIKGQDIAEYTRETDVLVSWSHASDMVDSAMKCCILCSSDSSCLSVSYNPTSSTCILSDLNINVVPSQVTKISAPGWVTYFRFMPASCAPDWHLYNNACYKVITKNQNWHSCESVCQNYGGHLTDVQNSAELTVIKQMAQTAYGGTYMIWIGLNDLAAEESFVWSSLAPFHYENWIPIRLSYSTLQNCVYMNSFDGSWDATFCDIETYCICKVTL